MSLGEDREANTDILSIGRSVAAFFESRENPGHSRVLGQLCERLAIRTSEGTSHLVPEEYEDLCSDPSVFSAVGKPGDFSPLILTEHKKLYFQKYFEYERMVADAFSFRAKKPVRKISSEVKEYFDGYVRQFLDPGQAIAVGVALQRSLSLLTGGPGTGKTRTLAYILACMFRKDPHLRVALCAPTGKAAHRMQRSLLQAIEQSELPADSRETMRECSRASTLHRLLGPVHGSVEFKKNSQNKLLYQLIVVDEASMIDLPLMAKLCDALPENTDLILCGDADQLSPVQGGPVFSSLIRGTNANAFSSEQVADLSFFAPSEIMQNPPLLSPLAGCTVKLSRAHRRNDSSGNDAIGDLCSAIREGRGDDALSVVRENNHSVQWIDSLDDPSVNDLIYAGFESLQCAHAPESALDALGHFKILCAHNQGKYGVDAWNLRAQSLLELGDNKAVPVVIGVNDYSIRLFNGDDGIVMNDQVYFSEIDQFRSVSRSRLPSHLLGYAGSIHRSQGSEYDHVLIILPPPEAKMLTRELLYVAVSRAKSGVTIVGNPSAFLSAINQPEMTTSGLVEQIK